MNDWLALRKHTQARIGLARSGAAVATRELLDFQLAHAQARDAVWKAWDVERCAAELEAKQVASVIVKSRAPDRATYLKRPDCGRRLNPASLPALAAAKLAPPAEVALILSDGLSATAVHEHGVGTLLEIRAALERSGTSCSPVVLAEHGRVALSDEIGHALGARVAVIVLGERPGLSAADSLGLYLTYHPAPGNTDAQRNCISNVRSPAGLAPQLAAARLTALLKRSLALGCSGVQLKDEAASLTNGKS
jgi:ethanolamine ammonia-lyase small subunit